MMLRLRKLYLAMALSLATGLVAPAYLCAADAPTGPWNLAELREPPEATWAEPADETEGSEPDGSETSAPDGSETSADEPKGDVKAGGATAKLNTEVSVQEVFYQGEPLGGVPTRVFAYYARPKQGDGPFPAMLLVHGAGGRAFADWAKQWAKRGYVALAMDLSGHGPDGERLPDGGPEQDDASKLREFAEGEADQMWAYHAVAAVIRGHSLLAAREEVDADRIGITGIDWGGFVTCIVAGLDDRLQAAVPVYGCGFLGEDSVWLPTFNRMSPEARERWMTNFDPSQYLGHTQCPMLFVNGTNDFAYPLDSFQKSYQLVPGRVELCVTRGMRHSHPDGWSPREIGIFVDGILKSGKPLPRLGPLQIEGSQVTAEFEGPTPVAAGYLHYAVADGPWNKRAWASMRVYVAGGKVMGELPRLRPIVCYVSITDARSAHVSTPHVVVVR
jgi:dienelactone hydrolase